MPNFSGSAATGGGALDGTTTHAPTTDELLHQLAEMVRQNGEVYRGLEKFFYGGIGSSVVDGLSIAAGGVLSVVAPPTAFIPPLLAAQIKAAGGVSALSGYTNWVANMLDPDSLQYGHPTGIGLNVIGGALAGVSLGLSGIATDVGVVRTDVGTVKTGITEVQTGGVALRETERSALADVFWKYYLPIFDPYFGFTQKEAWLAIAESIIGSITTANTDGWEIVGNPYFRVVAVSATLAAAAASQWIDNSDYTPRPGIIDPSLILPTDTVLTYLERTQPGWNWNMAGPTRGVYPTSSVWADVPYDYYSDHEWPGIWVRCVLSDADLQRMRPAVESVPGSYPGTGFVVDGQAVAFDGATSSIEPMAGCYVRITTIPPKQGVYIGPHNKRMPYLGFLTFLDDQGNADGVQRVEFERSIYTPLHLATAAGVDLFVKPGTVGVLQGWSIISA